MEEIFCMESDDLELFLTVFFIPFYCTYLYELKCYDFHITNVVDAHFSVLTSLLCRNTSVLDVAPGLNTTKKHSSPNIHKSSINVN